MTTFQWDESYSVNNREIDEQHQKWISLFDKLHLTMLNGTPDERAGVGLKVLEEMMDYTKYHFRLEEDYMRSIGYPEISGHRRHHRELDNLIYSNYRKVIDGHELVLNTEILSVVRSVLLGHILTEDKKYADFAKELDAEQGAAT